MYVHLLSFLPPSPPSLPQIFLERLLCTKAYLCLGEQALELCVYTRHLPAGHELLQRVNPQVTRSQINSAPPNMSQSSLVTACWTGGSSLALISPASVLRQAAIFHLLKTDDPGVREMKAPFNRSARDLAGKEGEGQSAAPSLPGQARSTCFRGHQACFLLPSARGIRSQGQDQGDYKPKAWLPIKVKLGVGPGGLICLESPRMPYCSPVQGGIPGCGFNSSSRLVVGGVLASGSHTERGAEVIPILVGFYIPGRTCLPARYNVFNSLK